MGLAKAMVNLLMSEAARRPFYGSVVTLGRQHVYVTAEETAAMAANHGVQLVSIPVELHREPSLSEQGFVSDDWLLKSLGFDEIIRLDYSDYESSEVIFDLNCPETPQSLVHRFDLVLDSGTLEHVFDIAAGLKHCVRMVKLNGRVIHLTPSSNCVEHGFYCVSPTLYADFYSASGFVINRVWLCESLSLSPRGDLRAYDYANSEERFISTGQLNNKVWLTYSVTTAEKPVTPQIPQQWIYTRTWSKAASESMPNKSGYTFEEGSRSNALIQKLNRFPWLQSNAVRLILRWRKWIHDKRVRSGKLPYKFVGKF